MRLAVALTGGSRTALPRVVSLLHRRAVSVARLEYCRGQDGHDSVLLDIDGPSRPDHLVRALGRLVEVLEVRQLPAATRATVAPSSLVSPRSA